MSTTENASRHEGKLLLVKYANKDELGCGFVYNTCSSGSSDGAVYVSVSWQHGGCSNVELCNLVVIKDLSKEIKTKY